MQPLDIEEPSASGAGYGSPTSTSGIAQRQHQDVAGASQQQQDDGAAHSPSRAAADVGPAIPIGFGLSLLILWGLVFYSDGTNGILFPLVFLPTVGFAVWWYRNRHLISLASIVYAYGLAFYCGSVYVMFYKVAIFMLVFETIRPEFYSEDFLFYLCLALYSWLGFAVGSEYMKFRIASRGRTERPDLVSVKAYLLYSTAGALGLVTFSLILEIFLLGYKFLTIGEMLISLVLRAWIDLPIQSATGYLIGISVAKNEIFKWNMSAWRILLIPVLVIGLSEMVFLVSVLIYGWPLDIKIISVAYALILVFLVPYVYYQGKDLPSSFALLNADDFAVDAPSPDRLDDDDLQSPVNNF
eukprot:TRINITY_DN6531_c0_g1_i2.p1 TRINITY_DN6531_c0_g1~~TRINITY_DN6531_c0_g1_i2.p1  ORF type:complete len:355 (-),score=89.63 TRINITY_DN6531_c0_g1_i2:736-1800(-)